MLPQPITQKRKNCDCELFGFLSGPPFPSLYDFVCGLIHAFVCAPPFRRGNGGPVMTAYDTGTGLILVVVVVVVTNFEALSPSDGGQIIIHPCVQQCASAWFERRLEKPIHLTQRGGGCVYHVIELNFAIFCIIFDVVHEMVALICQN